MARYEFTPEAEQNLRDIWRHIAPDNEPAADALLLRIFNQIELASRQPLMGTQRPELSNTARILIEGNYIIIYEPMPYGVLIVAIVYGGRNPRNWLDVT